ncbi:MAG TPA: hypothetical protein G4O06_07065 [Dehalococcoidia bacterium]|nr:hypothetical protein [Dehalococcoidia bacterium]
MPDVLDDPQFLPIITVAGTEKPELFYHLRQYTLSFRLQVEQKSSLFRSISLPQSSNYIPHFLVRAICP